MQYVLLSYCNDAFTTLASALCYAYIACLVMLSFTHIIKQQSDIFPEEARKTF
jgi:hypothetical protein